MAKVAHKEFSLASTAGRVALLVGVTAGTVSRTEVEAAVLRDTEKRPYRKPVVVPGIRGKEMHFTSVRFAAAYLLWLEHRKTGAPVGTYYARALGAIEKRIARYCNADNVKGFYWSN